MRDRRNSTEKMKGRDANADSKGRTRSKRPMSTRRTANNIARTNASARPKTAGSGGRSGGSGRAITGSKVRQKSMDADKKPQPESKSRQALRKNNTKAKMARNNAAAAKATAKRGAAKSAAKAAAKTVAKRATGAVGLAASAAAAGHKAAKRHGGKTVTRRGVQEGRHNKPASKVMSKAIAKRGGTPMRKK